MSHKKATVAEIKRQPDYAAMWTVLLWLVFCVNSLVLIPYCLDRYLSSRFFFLSLVLLAGIWMLRPDLKTRTDARLHGFDLLILGWYGLNLASVWWAFNWSEAIFYTQKVLLLVVVYWLIRQGLYRDEALVRKTLCQATMVLTFAVISILTVQIVLGFTRHGLDNESLYDYATGVFGNKSLASDLLFFLLVFNLLFYKDYKSPQSFWLATGPLLLLIVVMQTRTIYLAVAVCTVFYFLVRAIVEPGFRKIFIRRIVPAGILLTAALALFIVFRGKGNSMAERLDPTTYMESMSANERRFVWYKTDLLNKDHFWWGVGNGSWKLWLPSKSIEGGYRLQEQNIVFTRVHNDYLEMRAEMGIVGGVWFVLLFAAVFAAGIQAIRKTRDPDVRRDLLTILSGLLGYCVIQYFDFPRERIELQVMLAVLFGWAAFRSQKVWDGLPGIVYSKQSGFPAAVVMAGLAFNLLIGWNRIQGEMHNLNMLEAQAKRDYNTMIREAHAAQNPFYEYDDVALPMQYHEGIGYYYQEKTAEAIAAFSQAYRLNPWSFPVINNFASALAKAGRYKEAIPLLEKSVEINPRFDEGKLNLAFSWYQLGDYARSRSWVERVDTIRGPQNDADRRKNQLTKSRQAEFLKMLEGK